MVRDGQSQPRAAAFARGRCVHLREGLEEFLLVFGRDAGAGIRYADGDLRVSGGAVLDAGLHGDGTFVGEFGGVGKQVEQNLADAHGVRAHGGQVGGQVAVQGDWFILEQPGDGGHDAGGEFRQVDLIEGQLHLPGFDAREVEDVVDQAEQVLA